MLNIPILESKIPRFLETLSWNLEFEFWNIEKLNILISESKIKRFLETFSWSSSYKENTEISVFY